MTKLEEYISEKIDLAVKARLKSTNMPVVCVNTNTKLFEDVLCCRTQAFYFIEDVSCIEHTEQITLPYNWWNHFKKSVFGGLFTVKMITYAKKYSIMVYRVPVDILKINDTKLFNKTSINIETVSQHPDFGTDIKNKTVNRVGINVDYEFSIPINASNHEIVEHFAKKLPGLVNDITSHFRTFFFEDEFVFRYTLESPVNWYQSLISTLNPKKAVKLQQHVSETKISLKDLINNEYSNYEFYHVKIVEI